MSKVCDKAFSFGVGINLLLFLILNVASCVIAETEYLNKKYSNQGTQFADSGGYSWGFPLEIYHNFYGYPFDIGITWEGVLANTFVIIISSFVAGFLSQIIWSKINSRRSAKL